MLIMDADEQAKTLSSVSNFLASATGFRQHCVNAGTECIISGTSRTIWISSSSQKRPSWQDVGQKHHIPSPKRLKRDLFGDFDKPCYLKYLDDHKSVRFRNGQMSKV
jgi:hypothetical protein